MPAKLDPAAAPNGDPGQTNECAPAADRVSPSEPVEIFDDVGMQRGISVGPDPPAAEGALPADTGLNALLCAAGANPSALNANVSSLNDTTPASKLAPDSDAAIAEEAPDIEFNRNELFDNAGAVLDPPPISGNCPEAGAGAAGEETGAVAVPAHIGMTEESFGLLIT